MEPENQYAPNKEFVARTKALYMSSFKQKYPVEKSRVTIFNMASLIGFLRLVKAVFIKSAPAKKEDLGGQEW